MYSSSHHLRLALAGFLAIGGAIVWNVLAQDKVAPALHLAGKSEADRTRAAQDRNRRLALDAKEVQAVKDARTRTVTAAAPPAASPDLQINRVGRLSPGFKLERAAQVTDITADTIRIVQQRLAALGYFTAKIDGRTGEETERAVREYEMDSGLVPTGKVTPALVERLTRAPGQARPTAATKPAAR